MLEDAFGIEEFKQICLLRQQVLNQRQVDHAGPSREYHD
jgi:hypothetical protein